jgi:hypothetical protein
MCKKAQRCRRHLLAVVAIALYYPLSKALLSACR